MSHYAITGGAGFIGCNLVHELVRRKEKVTVIDNFSTGQRKNIESVLDKIDLIEGDITDFNLLKKVLRGVNYVLHQAALPSVPRSVKDPISTAQNNEIGTLNVLMAAKENKVKRVIYAASSSAYGEQKAKIKKENLPPNPKSPYAISKYTGELYCQNFHEIHGLETICLRYFNVFGPHQDPKSQYAAVIPRFITAILAGKRPTIYGDGLQSRDFTYVTNNVQANLLACQAPSEAAGRVFNMATGRSINLIELLNLIKSKLDSDIEPIFQAERPGDVKHSLADISLAQKHLGYKPQVDFPEGLEKTIDWFKENAKT